MAILNHTRTPSQALLDEAKWHRDRIEWIDGRVSEMKDEIASLERDRATHVTKEAEHRHAADRLAGIGEAA